MVKAYSVVYTTVLKHQLFKLTETGRTCFAKRSGGDSELRNIWFKWQLSDLATGCNIYFGEAPDKLYSSVMLYSVNEYYLKALEKDKLYYYQIAAFNKNGISNRRQVMKAE